jgi:hypothetical protein
VIRTLLASTEVFPTLPAEVSKILMTSRDTDPEGRRYIAVIFAGKGGNEGGVARLVEALADERSGVCKTAVDMMHTKSLLLDKRWEPLMMHPQRLGAAYKGSGSRLEPHQAKTPRAHR